MKKIMFYCHVFYPQNTGYSNAFQNLIYAILENDSYASITVVTPYPLEDGFQEIRKERLDVIRLKKRVPIKKVGYFLNDYFYAREVSNIYNSGEFDLLFVETFDQAFFMCFLDEKIYKRMAVRVHSVSETESTIFSRGLLYKIRKFIIKKILIKKVRWILSTNSFHIDFVKKYYLNENVIDIGDKNFFVLPNTINIKSDKYFDCSVHGKIKIFNLGRMDNRGNNQKGFFDFICALKLLPKDVLNKFEIKIVGKGDMRDTLISLCKELSNVTFIETMQHSEVISELKNSDVVILPSRYEGMSMFALEGMATGNVCLFSRTGGLIDMAGSNGILFEPQNIESMIKSLTKLSCMSEQDISYMKTESIKLFEEKFSPLVVSDKFKLIFNIIVCSTQR